MLICVNGDVPQLRHVDFRSISQKMTLAWHVGEHTLTNVHYAVSATGRTVSWSNTLPRYVLFSVQFRFNKQPKK